MTTPRELVMELHTRRRDLGIRQADLAARIGVSESALGRWERREQEPSLGTLCAWAEELDYDVELVTKLPGPPRAR